MYRLYLAIDTLKVYCCLNMSPNLKTILNKTIVIEQFTYTVIQSVNEPDSLVIISNNLVKIQNDMCS